MDISYIFSPDTLLPVMLAILILVLPGTAIYMGAAWLLGGRSHLSVWPALLPGIGLSVAFWPLLLLYCSLLGGRFTQAVVSVVLLVSLGVIVGLALAGKREEWPRRDKLIPALCLVGMTLLALAFRLGDIAGLAVPMFGDSLHHTMIASMITSAGQVPTGYAPYVPVDTFTYHFGFHTLAAVLAQLTGETPARAVLVMGQVLLVMALPVNYLLCSRLFNSRAAGLGAALITGFVSVMPAYYVNWGRYTQLAGLILLPVAATLLVRAVRQGSKPYETVLAGFCVAGLVVVHYRILIFYGLFILAFGFWFAIANRHDRTALIHALRQTAIVVLGGLVFTLPWIWNIATNYLPGLTRRLQTVSADYIASYNSWENMRLYVGLALPALGLLGLTLAILGFRVDQSKIQKPGSKILIAALGVATWTLLMIVSMWVPPGAIGSFTVALTMYIPLSLLGGFGIAAFGGMLAARAHAPAWALPVMLLVAAPVCAFLTGTWRVIDTGKYSYMHDADLAAFEWIKENTPQSAKFLLSSQISYAGRGVTASDAGMWLPLLTGRQVSVPALAAWAERPVQSDFFTETRKLATYTQPGIDPEIQRLVGIGSIPLPLAPSSPQMLAQMEKLGITHVYLGSPGGASVPRLDVSAMREDTCHYRLIRPPEDGVYIFEVNYQCP